MWQARHDASSQRDMLDVHLLLCLLKRCSRFSCHSFSYMIIDHRWHHRNRSTFLLGLLDIFFCTAIKTIFFPPLLTVRLGLQVDVFSKRNFFKVQSNCACTGGHDAFNGQKGFLLPIAQQSFGLVRLSQQNRAKPCLRSPIGKMQNYMRVARETSLFLNGSMKLLHSGERTAHKICSCSICVDDPCPTTICTKLVVKRHHAKNVFQEQTHADDEKFGLCNGVFC